MNSFSAIAPGTDLPRYARELVRMHDVLIGGGTGVPRPRALVVRSWSRVMRLGLHADDQNARALCDRDEVERLRRASPLHLVIDDLGRLLTSVADASHFLMVVTDAEGTILWRKGASAVCRHADHLGFAEGARWTEANVGTNAIGTALAEAAPVQLFSGEHFEQAQHPWYCTAYPVHDPRTGDMLGIVDVSGPALTLHPAIGALVESAVMLAESLLWRRHQELLEQLRVASEAAVAGTPGPAVVVDDNGWVAHSIGVSVRDRLAAPEHARAIAVPGLGLCVPERLSSGWLLRPAPTRQGITAALTLGPDPVLVVTSGDQEWRTGLSRRHAQILRLLQQAGRAGLTPQQLSAALFGDGEHAVSARAEVSRMRRTLGGLLAGSPYRLADGVTLTVDRSEQVAPV